MSKAKHTQANWIVRQETFRRAGHREEINRFLICEPTATGGMFVTAAINGPFPRGIARAMEHALLIASAPDLLAAAKQALKLISTPEIRWPGTLSIVAKDIREQLAEAIAQAEGTNP